MYRILLLFSISTRRRHHVLMTCLTPLKYLSINASWGFPTQLPLPSHPLAQSLSRFQAYNARFRMPSLESQAGHASAMWYSFNLGPAHWVVIDTETDFPNASDDHFTLYPKGNGGFGDQLTWLEEVSASSG